MKRKDMGSVQTTAGQTVTVEQINGVCPDCGTLGTPLAVVVKWGMTIECKLSPGLARTLANMLTAAAGTEPEAT